VHCLIWWVVVGFIVLLLFYNNPLLGVWSELLSVGCCVMLYAVVGVVMVLVFVIVD